MSKNKQLEKNLKLSEQLANYISEHPVFLKKYSGCSYVVFSSNDKGLNKMNEKLADSLKEEGKKVVIATKKNSKETPWNFKLIYA